MVKAVKCVAEVKEQTGYRIPTFNLVNIIVNKLDGARYCGYFLKKCTLLDSYEIVVIQVTS